MKIQVPFTTLRRIIHISDIHIRLFKRHAEYRKCFDTLFATLRASDVSETVIVVAGDVVHTKTDLSPEMIELTSYFLNSLAEIAPTIVITGNHDANLQNSSRLDALSPIIQNINNPQLYYLKYSGIYPCADVDFYVYSIIGEQSEWSPPELNERTKIALFHGPVHNAQTDMGYTITNRHVMIETFDGFDMVIMGDIHRHATLQEYSPEQKKPIIVYGSSCIQQSHGEFIRGHGWCDWDVKSRSFQFNELPNDHGFYTITVENGQIPDWSDMPKEVSLRIFAGSLEQSDIKKLISQIRLKHNIIELSVTNFEGVRSLVPSKTTGAVLDIHDVGVQNNLISEFLKETLPNISDDVLDRVLELNKVKNTEIVADELVRKVIWKPLTLHFDNLFTYGSGNVLNFQNMHGVQGIFAPNASGKTSIAEAICFALYDRTPRTTKAAHIMNTQSSTCYCKFEFEIEGVKYTVERKGTRNKKGEVKIDVDFYKIDNGIKVSLNGEERRYTNANIRTYVGDFDDFLLTTFSSSSQQGLFVDRNQADRKDLLTQFLGLNVFDKLHTRASEEIKEVQVALKRFKTDDFTQVLVDVQTELVTLNTLKQSEESTLSEISAGIDAVDAQIKQLYSLRAPEPKCMTADECDQLEHTATTTLSTATHQLQEIAIEREELDQKLQIAREKVTELAHIDDAYKVLQQQERELERVAQQHKTTQLLKNKVVKELEELQKHQFDPNCKFCVLNASHITSSITRTNQELVKLNDQSENFDAQIHGLTTHIESLASVREDYQKSVTMKTWIGTAERKLDQLDHSTTKIQNSITLAKSQLEFVQNERHTLQTVLNGILKNKEIDRQITELEFANRRDKAQLTPLRTNIQNFVSRIAVLGQKKQDMLDRIKEAETLEVKYEVYEAYLATVCRDGLPYRLIAKILPTLEASVNNLLQQMVGFTLIFDTDGKNINIKLRYDDTRIWPLELASGMEKFISSLAIRVALTAVSSLPRTSMIIVDEGFGTLDVEHLGDLSGLFMTLRSYFDIIFVITHVDTIKDLVDSRISITRDNGLSHITVH